MRPQAGRPNGPAVGRAVRQLSLVPLMSVAEITSGNAWLREPTGVNQVRLPLASRRDPVLNDWPGSRSGRQGPASEICQHSPMVGVKGKPPLQFVVFEICHPPTSRFMARLASLMNFLPRPTGSSYTVLSTKT